MCGMIGMLQIFGITGTSTRSSMIATSKHIRTVSHCVEVSCALGFRPLNESEGTWTVKCVGWNAWSAWHQDGPIGRYWKLQATENQLSTLR